MILKENIETLSKFWSDCTKNCFLTYSEMRTIEDFITNEIANAISLLWIFKDMKNIGHTMQLTEKEREEYKSYRNEISRQFLLAITKSSKAVNREEFMQSKILDLELDGTIKSKLISLGINMLKDFFEMFDIRKKLNTI